MRNPETEIGPADSLASVWMVLGDEGHLVRQAVEDIATKALTGGLAAFNRAEGSAAEGAIGEMIRLANTPPMMGPRRAVVIREMEKAPVADLEELQRYAASPNPTTVLVMCGTGTPPPKDGKDLGKRLQNAVQKSGRLLSFKAKESQPIEFVSERVRASGVKISRNNAEFLVEVVGNDLGRLACEVDKLLCFLGGKGEATAEAIEEICSLLAEAVIWDLTDAVVRRDVNRALAITHRMLEEGQAPQQILPLVTWQIRQLILLQSCILRGVNPYDEGIRMPADRQAAARASLRAHPLRTDYTMDLVAQANLDMHGHKAGDRRVLEGLILRLVAG